MKSYQKINRSIVFPVKQSGCNRTCFNSEKVQILAEDQSKVFAPLDDIENEEIYGRQNYARRNKIDKFS